MLAFKTMCETECYQIRLFVSTDILGLSHLLIAPGCSPTVFPAHPDPRGEGCPCIFCSVRTILMNGKRVLFASRRHIKDLFQNSYSSGAGQPSREVEGRSLLFHLPPYPSICLWTSPKQHTLGWSDWRWCLPSSCDGKRKVQRQFQRNHTCSVVSYVIHTDWWLWSCSLCGKLAQQVTSSCNLCKSTQQSCLHFGCKY